MLKKIKQQGYHPALNWAHTSSTDVMAPLIFVVFKGWRKRSRKRAALRSPSSERLTSEKTPECYLESFSPPGDWAGPRNQALVSRPVRAEHTGAQCVCVYVIVCICVCSCMCDCVCDCVYVCIYV